MVEEQNITSLQNTIVKLAASLHQKKHRQETGLFLIEGTKGVEEATKYGIEITHTFTDERILKKVSTTDTPPEVVAIAKQFTYSIEDLLKEETPLIIVLEDIRDPGNLGTIIRTAKAANASGIVLTGDTVDIFNPKVVRSSTGNLWKIPIVEFKDKSKLKDALKPCQIIGTSSHSTSKICFEVDYKRPTAVIFGSEAEGMSEELMQQVDSLAKIPINPEVESLNLSVSVSVILYEAFRQRS